MSTQKENIIVDIENDYLKALVKAFHQFLIEECTGASYSDLRLQKKLDAARLLFKEERNQLCDGLRFGQFNASNVKLIFQKR